VISELLTSLGSRSSAARMLQKATMLVAAKVLPEAFTTRLAWATYRSADAIIAGTSWEATLMRNMFGAPPSRLHIIPNGVESIFFPVAAFHAWRMDAV
jgi:hypothetical protein